MTINKRDVEVFNRYLERKIDRVLLYSIYESKGDGCIKLVCSYIDADKQYWKYDHV